MRLLWRCFFFLFPMTHPLLLAEHHWHISLGRQTYRLTDRAEALKHQHWERYSQGQRNCCLVCTELCPSQAELNADQGNHSKWCEAWEYVRSCIGDLHFAKKCFLWSALRENAGPTGSWPHAGIGAATGLWGKPCRRLSAQILMVATRHVHSS